MTHPTSLPELGHSRGLVVVRLPPDSNVGLSPRVLAIIDHPAFQRLRTVRQLGPTSLVYPGAVHTRFEHSIGVYHKVTLYLRRLLEVPAFGDVVTTEDVLTVLAAGLLHDLGHYPMAHSLEALHYKGNDTPKHEEIAGSVIRGELEVGAGDGTIGSILAELWGVDAERVIRLFTLGPRKLADPREALLASIVSSGIDADKMDYLARDSVHMGVPYGLNFDEGRLIECLTVGSDGRSIGLTAKGKTAAEMFAFSRYTMFSEAYWHHAVRAASAMVEASLSDLQARGRLPARREAMVEDLLRRGDDALLEWLGELAPVDSAARRLLAGLTGHRRQLHKRALELSDAAGTARHRAAHRRLMALSAPSLRGMTVVMREALRTELGVGLADGELIIDTPPRDKDRWDDVEILPQRSWHGPPRGLREVSAVVRGIAEDFVSVVKKTRIFVAPWAIGALRAEQDRVEGLLLEVALDGEAVE